MTLLEDVKKTAEQVTGWQRPTSEQLRALPRQGKIGVFNFKQGGLVPNHPHWPLIILWRAVRLPRSVDPAAVFEDLFDSDGWGDSWRDGVYDHLHYYSRTQEVMGVARGSANIRFGGEQGRTVGQRAGDVAILPAGTGHQCLSATKAFLVVGAYPPCGTYDECLLRKGDFAQNAARVRKVASPRKDPVFGRHGPLLRCWSY